MLADEHRNEAGSTIGTTLTRQRPAQIDDARCVLLRDNQLGFLLHKRHSLSIQLTHTHTRSLSHTHTLSHTHPHTLTHSHTLSRALSLFAFYYASLTLLHRDGSFGPYPRFLVAQRNPNGAVQRLHLVRPAADASTSERTAFAREAHIYSLLSHEHLLALFGTVTQANNDILGLVFPILPYELEDALAGQPALTPKQEVDALVGVGAGLEFLVARRLFFAEVVLADVGLSAAYVAKVRCAHVRPGGSEDQEKTVTAAYGRLVLAAAAVSKAINTRSDLMHIAQSCVSEAVSTVCALVLELTTVRRVRGTRTERRVALEFWVLF